jgi:hypothetical protein
VECQVLRTIALLLYSVLREQGIHFPSESLAKPLLQLQTKLFVTSEVPIYKVFSDDPQANGPQPVSDHMRSVMDDLVGLFYSLSAFCSYGSLPASLDA